MGLRHQVGLQIYNNMIKGVRRYQGGSKKKYAKRKAERALEKAKKQEKAVKRIACPEDVQVYQWQRTHKKAWYGHHTKVTGAYTPRTIEDVRAELKKMKKKKKKYIKPPGPK